MSKVTVTPVEAHRLNLENTDNDFIYDASVSELSSVAMAQNALDILLLGLPAAALTPTEAGLAHATACRSIELSFLREFNVATDGASLREMMTWSYQLSEAQDERKGKGDPTPVLDAMMTELSQLGMTKVQLVDSIILAEQNFTSVFVLVAKKKRLLTLLDMIDLTAADALTQIAAITW